MSSTNLELEKQLDALADICCDKLSGDTSDTTARRDAILKALLMSGYARKGGHQLGADIEKRVKQKCREPVMHRGGELAGLLHQIQHSYEKLVRWESESPKDKQPAKGANISSATDA